MIRQLKQGEFNQAISFANKIFFKAKDNDFLIIQPKVYNYPLQHYKNHYVYEIDNMIVGLIGSYPSRYHDLKILGIGTVCVDELYRNQGIMQKMLCYLESSIAPNYDLLYLSGDKKRYEYFGFYKTGQKITFRIKARNIKHNQNYLIKFYQHSDEAINQTIYNLYQSKEKVKRELYNFYDNLKTSSYEIYLIYDDADIAGYIVYDRKNNTIKEIIRNKDDLMDILSSFIIFLDISIIYYEVSIDDNDLKLLYDIADSYQIANLTNIKIINYINVIEKLLKKKINIAKGSLTIKIIDKINIIIEVRNEVIVKEINDRDTYDLVLTEKEVHQLLFDNIYFYQEKYQNNNLICSYFPLVIPASISSIDSF